MVTHSISDRIGRLAFDIVLNWQPSTRTGRYGGPSIPSENALFVRRCRCCPVGDFLPALVPPTPSVCERNQCKERKQIPFTESRNATSMLLNVLCWREASSLLDYDKIRSKSICIRRWSAPLIMLPVHLVGGHPTL
ncbi:hypothetical protein EVAR_46512_1 [Eumeta japonica]|uniref:Uncharacterized protein n=1 Tax=Eumeta variegata TaxID=151549 RepID=A0A4C1WRM2_EUMVA|nr:hypothetical protein EVAR_46512_1 [Eumeta japonica]